MFRLTWTNAELQVQVTQVRCLDHNPEEITTKEEKCQDNHPSYTTPNHHQLCPTNDIIETRKVSLRHAICPPHDKPSSHPSESTNLTHNNPPTIKTTRPPTTQECPHPPTSPAKGPATSTNTLAIPPNNVSLLYPRKSRAPTLDPSTSVKRQTVIATRPSLTPAKNLFSTAVNGRTTQTKRGISVIV